MSVIDARELGVVAALAFTEDGQLATPRAYGMASSSISPG